MSEQASCAGCGREFTRRSGRGRPARYCGSVCRRAAEYALNRCQGLLRRAQQRWQDASLEVAMAVRFGAVEAERKREFWAGEVVRLEGELCRLLATDLDASTAAPEYPKTA